MLIDVRGTRLHIDQRGPQDAPPLLYLHGGPGSGSHDFMFFQGDRLSERLQLVGVDQRGVQRSDPLDGPITEDDLIADFEALRETLGFERWSILGHSYGGRLALRYAVTHPDTVARVVFENPPWDMVLATRTLLDAARPLLRERGDRERAEELLRYRGPATAQMWDERIALTQRLGERRMDIYLGPGSRGLVLPGNDLPEEIRSRGARFAEEITRTAGFSESLLPLLERLTQPALLIEGGHDPVTSPEEISLFQKHVQNGTFRRFESAGHFVHAEEPEEYARFVAAFVVSEAVR